MPSWFSFYKPYLEANADSKYLHVVCCKQELASSRAYKASIMAASICSFAIGCSSVPKSGNTVMNACMQLFTGTLGTLECIVTVQCSTVVNVAA